MQKHNDHTSTNRQWLTVKDLAQRYKVTEACIWKWVKSGNLPPPRSLGPQTRRWPPEVIETFEAQKQKDRPVSSIESRNDKRA